MTLEKLRHISKAYKKLNGTRPVAIYMSEADVKELIGDKDFIEVDYPSAFPNNAPPNLHGIIAETKVYSDPALKYGEYFTSEK